MLYALPTTCSSGLSSTSLPGAISSPRSPAAQTVNGTSQLAPMIGLRTQQSLPCWQALQGQCGPVQAGQRQAVQCLIAWPL